MASVCRLETSDPDTNILNNGIVRIRHCSVRRATLCPVSCSKITSRASEVCCSHRFLVATSDEDEGVHLAETVLCGPLGYATKSCFFNHFVEALFVLNRCTAHPIYVAAATMATTEAAVLLLF
jgi:hypothetical protein